MRYKVKIMTNKVNIVRNKVAIIWEIKSQLWQIKWLYISEFFKHQHLTLVKYH